MEKQITRGRAVGEVMMGRIVNIGMQDCEALEDDGQLMEKSLKRNGRRSANFVRLAQLRKLRECEQVAAVCYRWRNGKIEFLLVQTGGGRWTFPKGSAEPGLTHAQAAALEAFEEAGVHGRMEEGSFTRYRYSKRARNSTSTKLAVSAHLCEVSRLEAPEESNRNPTWFSTAEAKRCFRKNHTSGAELARVVDCAVRRIRHLRIETRVQGVSRKAQVIEIDYLQRAAKRRPLLLS
jgi:8-oxo-dGTP pyrophosphatase MutT (NUDIX family)